MRPPTEAANPALIDVVLNGAQFATRARTLANLVAEAGYSDSRVATSLNGDFVPASARRTTWLKAGDRIEVVAARQGG